MNDRSRSDRDEASSAGADFVARIFAGDGEMAELIRTTDWSRTPLGPIASWPQSLRTAVSICLGSRHPIVLWWGPERWMFYNDAYRPMLGDLKHPQFLGAPGQGCWAEIWDIIGPMMDRVIATGEATWSEDLFLAMMRHGYLEETYFTFSYSPIRDDAGTPSGIFNACTESTARVLGARRMKTLRELTFEARSVREAARTCAEILGRNARDVPFALVYLGDPERTELQLAGAAVLAPGGAASPLSVSRLDTADASGWPLARVAASGRAELVEHLDQRFACLPKEPWDEPAHQAMLLPIAQAGSDESAGVLVLGISPRRAFDDDYRGFFALAASHVRTAVANAHAVEAERERAEKLAELDRVKTAFFSNVSHEFRTPLTLILGPLEDALGDPDHALRGESLEAVYRNALRLLRLVNSLLDFARLEADRLTSSFEPIDLATVTAGLAGSFQSLLEAASLELVVECPPLAEPAWVDRSQWEKIVLNLVSNAYKFTFAGQIAVRLRERAGRIELSVSDTGTGIPAEELPKIFDRFHRVEGAKGRSFEGTGIGLSLVKELTRLHGGAVDVESVVGRGTTFVVSMPTGASHLPQERLRVPQQAAAPAAPIDVREFAIWQDPQRSPGQAAQVPSEHARARILVADDNADMRQYLLRLLEPHWQVELCGDGKAALERARAEPPDLILSDVTMPELDGIALLAALRAEPRTSTIPVILLSARAGEDAVVSGLETGADDYLVKPFSARELLSRVRTLLALSQVRRAAAEATRELSEMRAALVEELEAKNADLASAYRELQTTQTQLVQSAKMASLGELVAGVAHEINNPLAFALGHLDTVQRSLGQVEAKVTLAEDSAPHFRRALDRIRELHQGLRRIQDLVLKLRTFSRLDEGERKLASMRENVESVLAILKHRCESRIQLVTQFGEPDQIDCYPGLLNQALMNLVSNAIDAITGDGTISISTRAEGDAYAISVADTGSGIPENIRERVLEPFFTTKPVGQGVGLGLSIAYSIAKKHGGRLEHSARNGGGTVATISFPLERD